MNLRLLSGSMRPLNLFLERSSSARPKSFWNDLGIDPAIKLSVGAGDNGNGEKGWVKSVCLCFKSFT